MLKLKIIGFFIIFIMLLSTTSCRQRIIENPLPLQSEDFTSYEEPTEEPTIEITSSVPETTEAATIPEQTTEQTTELITEPTIEQTTAPETTTNYKEPPQTEPVAIPEETTTEPLPTDTQNIIRSEVEVVTSEPVSYTEAVSDIEVVKQADDIFQVLDENNKNIEDSEKQEENISNQDEIQNDEQEQYEVPPEAADTGEKIVTLEELPEEREESAISDNGTGTIGIIVDSYAEFLNTSLLTLYDCQKYYIYYEEINDYQTINRASAEHKLIVEASGYNVGEKLKDDALTVSADWVLRKNPSMIIKCVGGDILGRNINETSHAESVSEDIASRSEWDGIGAVINRNIILISEELLSSEDGRLLAKLYIASMMYPELFDGVEISDFCVQIKDAAGNDYTNGIYFYSDSNHNNG